MVWNSSVRAVINNWLLTKNPLGLHWQLVSAPPPSTRHLLGGFSVRKRCLSDARNNILWHIHARSSERRSPIEQLPPLAAWQQCWVRYAINLSHLTADSAGYPPSTPLFCFAPRSDMSCPHEDNPEIWSGKRMVQNRGSRLLKCHLYWGQATVWQEIGSIRSMGWNQLSVHWCKWDWRYINLSNYTQCDKLNLKNLKRKSRLTTKCCITRFEFTML